MRAAPVYQGLAIPGTREPPSRIRSSPGTQGLGERPIIAAKARLCLGSGQELAMKTEQMCWSATGGWVRPPPAALGESADLVIAFAARDILEGDRAPLRAIRE